MLRRALGFGMTVKVYDPFLAADAFGDDATVVTLNAWIDHTTVRGVVNQ